MRLILTVFSLLFSCMIFSQVKIDSTKINGHSLYFYEALDADSIFYSSVISNDGINSKNKLNIYDKNINLLDSISPTETGRNSASIGQFFQYKGSAYVLAIDAQLEYTMHKIKGFHLSDSIDPQLDTLLRSFYKNAWEINNNTLRILLYEFDSNYQFIKKSKIIDLDSNFQMTAYRAFDFDSITRRSNSIITDVNFINDSAWHIYTGSPSGALHVYNPQTGVIDSSHYLWNDVKSCYPLNSSEYLAMGIVSWSPPVLGMPYTGMNALGFYRMSNEGIPLDTSYFLNIDKRAPGVLDFSTERMNVPAAIVYDTNTIYLASESSYTANVQGSRQEGYLFVVKTDSRGNEHWRFSWGGTFKISSLRGLVSTPDSGCIVVGNYAYEYPQTGNLAMILIKLGPDGTISNVELDAPENLVEFYPNPVKNKLMYRYLPEAGELYHLEIMDMNGRPVMEANLTNHESSIPVDLKPGFYIYHLKDQAGKVMQVGKLVAE